jgi:NAD/NADP transhydrogenase beta subunit
MLPIVVLLGASLGLFGALIYAKDTLFGGTKPNRVSWLLWCLAPLIGTGASLAAGVTWAALPTFVAGLGPLIVLVASFANKKAYWKLEKTDYLCGLFSLLALVLWAVTKNPSIAIIFAIVADAFAAFPTIMKGWWYPETESSSAYLGGIVSAASAFTVITTWTFPQYAFPAYLVVVNIALAFPLVWKRDSRVAHK